MDGSRTLAFKLRESISDILDIKMSLGHGGEEPLMLTVFFGSCYVMMEGSVLLYRREELRSF